MENFFIALQFLTILPVKLRQEVKNEDFGRSLVYFPLVGLLIGMVLSLSALLFSPLPPNLRAAMILIISIIVTGGIHLEGFSDTCDGFYGNNSKEKILEVMRDSHIGTMGAIGVVSILLLKFSLIASLSEDVLWKALILMAIASRCAQVAACRGASYARQEGKAKYFVEYATRKALSISFLFTLVLFCLFFRLKGLVIFFALVLSFIFFLRYIKKRIGGVTGDTIGALSELIEVLVLLLVFLIR